MAESVVASAAQWIGNQLIQETNILFDVADQIGSLQEELELMQEYLQDAEAKQEDGEVGTLIRQMRKLAYDAEDVIDSYVTKVGGFVEHNNGNWLMRFSSSLYRAPHIYKAGKRIQGIQSRVERIHERLNDQGVRRIPKFAEILEGFRLLPRDEGNQTRRFSYPYDDSNFDYVVGLEKEIPKLLEVLMGESSTHVNVVSIVGMGGSGKTTLASKLYSHPYARECFDCMAWVFISQEWSTRHTLSEILRKVGDFGDGETTHLYVELSMDELVGKLRNTLSEKPYLVVLDDVWRREALEQILPALPQGDVNKGSKIIITTRNRDIIHFQRLQHRMYVHEPRPLSEDEGWELLRRLISRQHINCNTESFQRLGKEMLKKCCGLPLAISALAGILNTRVSIGEWQQVSETVRSRVMVETHYNMSKSVQDLLALSYDDLPYNLKTCLLYLGVFPEDCQIPTGMLTRMWIGEGLVDARANMSPEDVAMQYLEELSHRFLIQVVRTNFKGVIKAITLHDLLRDLCLRKAKEQSFLQNYTAVSDQASYASALAIQPRRAALHSSVSLPKQGSKLRSLVMLTRSSILHTTYISKEMLDLKDVHQNFKLLRLLNLWGIKTANCTLPKQIGSLIHLRYLGIRASNITTLPSSIGKLRNLLTLDYRNVDIDEKVPITIPDALAKLVLLRHLFLPIECPWSLNSLQLSALKNLQILWGVRCNGGSHDWFSRELPRLSKTVKKLNVIVSVEKDLKAAFNCPSLMSDRLHTFRCQWRDGLALQCVNSALFENQHLHKLVLVGKLQVKNLSIILPSNLVILELRDSLLHDEDPMVAIGALSHLKLLRLSNSYLGTAFNCEADSFPMLEELYLENLSNLSIWKIQKGAMPCLKKLVIIKCGNLRKFPEGIPFVATLQQLEAFGVPNKFGEKAIECGWSKQSLRLPHNIEAIIERCDSPVDISSIRKLYEQVTKGIFLNNKKQKYWVMKQNNHYYNCFMLFATHLWPNHPYWELIEMEDSEGALITVAKLKSSPYFNSFVGQGEFNTKDLSLGATYKIAFLVMLPQTASGQYKSPELSSHSFASSRFERYSLTNVYTRPSMTNLYLPSDVYQWQEHKLMEKPKDTWIRLSIGEFEVSSSNIGIMTFSLDWIKPGVVIQGVIIEPKLEDC